MSTSAAAAPAGSDNPSNPPSIYNCNTCLISFEDSETHRAHVRGDWHVYNLKRRISSLPAVSSQVFEEKVGPSLVATQERDESSIYENCEVCGETFHSRQAYKGHLRSRHHAQNLAAVEAASQPGLQEDTPIAEMKSVSLDGPEDSFPEKTPARAEDDFSPSACLFCPLASTSMPENLTHMQRIHGLFIPDPEHLLDMCSFIDYLWTVISEFHECLYCSITKSTTEAVQHHMKDKGHCKIDCDPASEWRLFYDYDPESGSDAGSPSHDGHTAVRGKEAGSTTTTAAAAVDSEDELRLPSGKILGHRSHTRHRRPDTGETRTPPSSAPAATDFSAPDTALSLTTASSSDAGASHQHRHQHQHRQQLVIRNGDRQSMIGVPAQQQRALRAKEKMMLKRENRARDAYQAGVQKAANRQKFFKPDVPGPSNG